MMIKLFCRDTDIPYKSVLKKKKTQKSPAENSFQL